MDNRSKILACALELFSSRGYEGIGVQEIVEAAGITKPTLYHYFGSKEGLLRQLFTEYSDRLYEKLKPAADYQHDLPLTMDRIAAVYFDFAKHNPAFFRMQMAFLSAPPESPAYRIASECSGRIYQLLEQMFLQAGAQHGNMKGRHTMYAVTLMGMLHTYIALMASGQVEMRDQLRRQAVHQFMHGIFS